MRRNAITLFLIALLLYIGIHLLARTDGARSAVADKISNGTRQPVAIEQCGATPLLGLHLKGLSFYGVETGDVTVKFNWLAFVFRHKPLIKRLDIQGLEVSLKRVPTSGHWEPLVLHGLGSRLGAVVGVNPSQTHMDNSLPRFPAYALNEKTLLQLHRAKISWRDEQGRELAYITDADLSVRAGAFTDRKVVQSIVHCGHVRLASGQMLRDFRLEAFQVEGSAIVTVLDMADADGEYPEFATETLWQDLNQQLNTLSEL